MRDPTGTPTGPEEQRRTADSVICDQPAMPMRYPQCSEATSVFGGIADMAGLAIAATRSRLTPIQTLAFWYPCHAHAPRDSLFGSEKCGIVAHRIGEETAASEIGIECKSVLCSRSCLFQLAEQRQGSGEMEMRDGVISINLERLSYP